MSQLVGMRNQLRVSLDRDRLVKLKKLQALRFRGLQHFIQRVFFGSNLKALAVLNVTDKWGIHSYAPHYQAFFAPLRRKRINLLEIGVGGYHDPKLGGASLRLWRTYFPRGRIFGIDIHDKSLHDEPRIRTFQGSQVDEGFLSQVVDAIGRVDIIIDDGSHENEDVLRTFAFLFPRLSENGIYVIEDTQTSYWSRYDGSSDELDRSDTTMGFLKKLADGLNYAEFEKEGYEPNYYDTHIVGIHFFHNIVFVQKGMNCEGSNIRR